MIKKAKKNAGERYKSVSKKEKEQKRQYGRELYKNLAKDEEQNLAEYRKMRKNEKKVLL